MANNKRTARVEVHAERPSVPKYAELDQVARDAIADALLVLVARGRQVLAGQGRTPTTKAAQRASEDLRA